MKIARASRTPRRLDALESILNRTRVLDWVAKEDNPGIDEASEPALVGFDTSALKAFRRNPIEWNRLLDRLQERGVFVVVPGQAVQEYWNNHETFTKEDVTRIRNSVNRLSSEVNSAGVTTPSVLVQDLERVVAEFDKEMDELGDDRVFLQRSLDVLTKALRSAEVPFVPRVRFRDIADVRLASKVAPGYDDAKTKISALGDFFVWADFLLGVMRAPASAQAGPDGARKFGVFVTNDQKSDWRTGMLPHPALSAEFQAASGLRLGVVTPSEFQRSAYYRGWIAR